MDPETRIRYCCVNCVSIIPVSPLQSREIIYVGVGPQHCAIVISALGRVKMEGCDFDARLGFPPNVYANV